MDLTTDIAAIIAQGADPARFAAALAKLHGLAEVTVQAAIAQAGKPRDLHPEDVAQARLRADRQYARTRQYRKEYLRSEHEED